MASGNNTPIEFEFSDNDILSKRVTTWLNKFPIDTPLIFVPVFNAYDDVIECLASLIHTLSKDIPILLLDDASTDNRITTISALEKQHTFCYARKQQNTGFVESVNFAFKVANRRDIVIVNSDVILPPNWLDRMREAAYSRTTIATVTAFTNNGTIVSIPYRNRPIHYLPNEMTTEQVDQRVRASSLRLRPIIPTAIGHCTYVKRAVLDSIGELDVAFSPGYGEEVDFSQRAVIAGFCHVVADDVFVFHKGSRSFTERGREEKSYIQQNHEQIINARYPWYRSWIVQVEQDTRSPFALSIERARFALLGNHIAIDATYLDGSITGTQVMALELIRALVVAKEPQLHLSIIISDQTTHKILAGLEKMVDSVLNLRDVSHVQQPMFDLIHRPFQVRTSQDFEILRRLGRRIIISHLDCISYANPSYASSTESWHTYRSLTQQVFETADGIAFISHDGIADARHHGLCAPEERMQVTFVGVDHHVHLVNPTRPLQMAELNQDPFVLMLGTNFRHKNRRFALRIFQKLLEQYNWHGYLVIAGPNVASGGSGAEEALEHLQSERLHAKTIYLGAVSEGEKQWLLQQAKVVLYTSNYEGFGMVPFEAAAVGTPALTTRATSLQEVLGSNVSYLDNFDPEEGAQKLWEMLTDINIANKQVREIQDRATNYSWERVSELTRSFYRHILSLPPRTSIDLPIDKSSLISTVAPNPLVFPTARVEFPHQPNIAVRSQSERREHPVRGVWRRFRRAQYIYRTEGFTGLQTNIKGYLVWWITQKL